MNKLKQILKYIIASLISIGTICLVILKIKERRITEIDHEYSKLEGKQDSITDSINTIESHMNDPIDDLTDSEVEDYWRDRI